MADSAPLLQLDARGLRCSAGGFHVDPWKPVETAVITHAHADHARRGSRRYVATRQSVPILRHRLGAGIEIEGLEYGEVRRFGDVEVSLHPAGHVLGSAQVRVASAETTWVVSGDYKRDPDPTCAAFEAVEADVFVTEATFALPVYRWPDTTAVAREILAWWNACRAAERPAVLFCYAFGKAQRLLAELSALTDRTVYLHGAMLDLVALYREQGVTMLPTEAVTKAPEGHRFAGDLVLAPPSASRSAWMKRMPGAETAFASGWMTLRGTRRHRGYDRGFVVSDHADWPSLLRTIEETGAGTVLVTHGNADVLVRVLRERGLDARALETAFGGEEGDAT